MEKCYFKEGKRPSVQYGASSRTHVKVLLEGMVLHFKYLIVIHPLEKTVWTSLRKLKKKKEKLTTMCFSNSFSELLEENESTLTQKGT